jgi:hypothetical protein
MALTQVQQRRFHSAALRWLRDQLAAGNDRALYQLWKANATQTKAAIEPYLLADRSDVTSAQSGATTARAAEDAAWTATIAEIDAVIADANP